MKKFKKWAICLIALLATVSLFSCVNNSISENQHNSVTSSSAEEVASSSANQDDTVVQETNIAEAPSKEKSSSLSSAYSSDNYNSSSSSSYSSSTYNSSSKSSSWGNCDRCHKKAATHGIYCDDCYYDKINELNNKGISQTELKMWANGYSEYDDAYSYY